jgi:hypothetical protein
MSRVIQPEGQRGSLKWIQTCVNKHPHAIDDAILAKLPTAKSINWHSPRADDGFAEYRDGAFLSLLGLERLGTDLAAFWPQRGPQWDALARSDDGNIFLVEAKAHIEEIFSPASAAGADSRERIAAALAKTIAACGAKPKTAWIETFYQLGNRLAHLHFLRSRSVPAWLVLVNFVGDREMNGPSTRGEWEAAYRVVYHVMGIAERTPLLRHVLHVYPDVSRLG